MTDKKPEQDQLDLDSAELEVMPEASSTQDAPSTKSSTKADKPATKAPKKTARKPTKKATKRTASAKSDKKDSVSASAEAPEKQDDTAAASTPDAAGTLNVDNQSSTSDKASTANIAEPAALPDAPSISASTKDSVAKVRKPEPLGDLVGSSRIIEIPTIEFSGDAQTTTVPTFDASQAVPASQVPQNLPIIQASQGIRTPQGNQDALNKAIESLPEEMPITKQEKPASDIDALFAEVSAEYEAEKAQEKAEREFINDIDEPPSSALEPIESSETQTQEVQELPTAISEATEEPQDTLTKSAKETELSLSKPDDGAASEDISPLQPKIAEDNQESQENTSEDEPAFKEYGSTFREFNPEDGKEDSAPAGPSALDTVRTYADKGISAINEGISAVRNLSEAKHAHAQARDALAEIEQHAANLSDQLAYRQDVTSNFDAIIAAQNDEIQAANSAFSEAADRQKTFEDQLTQGNAYLDKLKAANIKEVAPYRELADSAKSVLEDAEQTYHNARSSLRIAKSQHRDALNSHEAQVSNANRAVENAAARLAELQDAYTQMKRDSTTGAKELTDTNRNVAAALAQLENAKAKAADVASETTQAVANAQEQLDYQQQIMDQAEAALSEAQRDERDKRDQYETMRKNADADEKDIAAQLSEIEHKMQQASKDQETANRRISAAQAAIAEYKDIQAHPEITQNLSEQLDEAQAQIKTQQEEVDRLAEQEEGLTQTTQNVRVALFVAIGVLLVILILIIWLFFIR